MTAVVQLSAIDADADAKAAECSEMSASSSEVFRGRDTIYLGPACSMAPIAHGAQDCTHREMHENESIQLNKHKCYCASNGRKMCM